MNRTTVVNRHYQPFDVYIGRPSKWGNPYGHRPDTAAEFRVKTRAEAIAKYREWIQSQPELLAALDELKGKRLGCWCKPLPCHGEVLVDLIERAPVQMKLFRK